MSSEHPDTSRTPGPDGRLPLEFPGGSHDFGLRPRSKSGKGKARRVDPLLGADLGGVTITRLVGEGGMGRVYEAQQASPRRTVAVKVIRFGLTSEKTLRRFEREAEFLGKLQHPGVAQIHAVGTYDSDFGEVPFFVMEYVANAKPITNFAHEHDLSLKQRLKLFKRVCEAVSHGHDRGIVHRDLKPGNILVDSRGNPKVIDFGVARSTDSDLTLTKMKTDTGALVGTIQHMAPEQFGESAARIDARADVYSLGVVLYELLSGELPYQLQKKPMHEASRIVCEEIPRPLRSRDKSIPKEVSLIAERCLQKGRRGRYHTAGELAADVERYLNGKPLSARTGSVLARGWRSTARLMRRRWLVVPMVALMGLAGGVALVRQGPQGGQQEGQQGAQQLGEELSKPSGAQRQLPARPAPDAQAVAPLAPRPTASPVAEKPGTESPSVGPAASQAVIQAVTQATSPEAPADEAAAIVEGVTKTLREQFAACNEESMEKLLPSMSSEVPSLADWKLNVDQSWSVADTYYVLDGVELLSDSDAPDAMFEAPYATVRVTQTVIPLSTGDERVEVFRRKCRKAGINPVEEAKRLDVLIYADAITTTSSELLFKHESGQWRLVKALTEPTWAGKDAGKPPFNIPGVPFQMKFRVSQSIFK